MPGRVGSPVGPVVVPKTPDAPSAETAPHAAPETPVPGDEFQKDASLLMRGAHLGEKVLKLSEDAETAGEIGDGVNETAEVVGEAAEHAKSVGSHLSKGDVKTAVKKLLKPVQEEVEHEGGKLDKVTKGLGHAAGALGVVTLPGKVVTASEDVRAAFKHPTRATVGKAIDSVSDAGYTAAVVTQHVALPVAEKVAAKIAKPVAAKAVAHVTAAAAEHVAVEAGTHIAAEAGGKLLAKVTPGLNVVMTAMDTAHFASVAMNKKAPMGQKIAAGLTALGDLIACSNIPLLGWAGAALSVGASVYESVHYPSK